MDRFVIGENLKRFQKLASRAVTEKEKSKLLALLGEEEAKFIELQRAKGEAKEKASKDPPI
jgi:hypothetical protein